MVLPVGKSVKVVPRTQFVKHDDQPRRHRGWREGVAHANASAWIAVGGVVRAVEREVAVRRVSSEPQGISSNHTRLPKYPRGATGGWICEARFEQATNLVRIYVARRQHAPNPQVNVNERRNSDVYL